MERPSHKTNKRQLAATRAAREVDFIKWLNEPGVSAIGAEILDKYDRVYEFKLWNSLKAIKGFRSHIVIEADRLALIDLYATARQINLTKLERAHLANGDTKPRR